LGSLKIKPKIIKKVASIIAALLIGYFLKLKGSEAIPNAQSLPTVSGNLRICTQNLYRLGSNKDYEDPRYLKQQAYLVKRMTNANCSLVALQEVPIANSDKVLENLTREISKKNGKVFEIIVGESNTKEITNAFIVSKSDFVVKKIESFKDSMLPKFDSRDRPWTYSRGPLAITLKSKLNDKQIELFVVNDHLKSKSGGWKDRSETNFENFRVLSAAGIKNKLLDKRNDKIIEIFLGDRNANQNSASSLIFSGRVHLEDFQKNGNCEISEKGSALCPSDSYDKPDMIPLLETAGDKSQMPFSTFKYGKESELLDEIYVFIEDDHFFKDKIGRYRAGVEGEYRKGSDHLLSWVELSLD
jgi:hypothetical protein